MGIGRYGNWAIWEDIWKAVSDVTSGALRVVMFTTRSRQQPMEGEFLLRVVNIATRSRQRPIQKRDLGFLLRVVDNHQ